MYSIRTEQYRVIDAVYTIDDQGITVQTVSVADTDYSTEQYDDIDELYAHLSSIPNVETVAIYDERQNGTDLRVDLFEGLSGVRELTLDGVSIHLSTALYPLRYSLTRLVLRDMNIDSLDRLQTEELEWLEINRCTYNRNSPLDLNDCNALQVLDILNSNIGTVSDVSLCTTLATIAIQDTDCSDTATRSIDWSRLHLILTVQYH